MTVSGTSALRIAVVHSYYSTRQPSGENVVVDLQVDALRRAGHDVTVVSRRTDDLEQTRSYPLRAGLRVATGQGDNPLAEIAEANPDVVHVHNLFPNFGRRWIRLVNAPVVATLHNYRPLCAAGILLRDGQGCTQCPDSGSSLPAVVHGCYRERRVASVPVALGTRFAKDPVLTHARRVITLNPAMRRQYIDVGVPEQRLVTVPNFVPAVDMPGIHDEEFWLFVGRLTPEKGIDRLVRDWPSGHRLLVVGSGPLAEELQRLSVPGVEFLGQRTNAEVRELLGKARGLFFPSVWPEGLPTVYLEALAAGLPVVASPQSVVGSLVADEGTGLVSSGSTAADLEAATALFPSLGERCRAVYNAQYTESAWLSAVTALYRTVMQ